MKPKRNQKGKNRGQTTEFPFSKPESLNGKREFSGLTPIFSLCIFMVLAGAIPATAQTKRPMALNDLITAVRVGDPQLSPDGRQVLYVRTTTDGQTGKRNADIWSVPADGSRPASEFIGGDKAENTPRFSPDGKRIVFISTRDGAAQVYVRIPMAAASSRSPGCPPVSNRRLSSRVTAKESRLFQMLIPRARMKTATRRRGRDWKRTR